MKTANFPPVENSSICDAPAASGMDLSPGAR